MNALTLKELSAITCSNPLCKTPDHTEIVLSPVCHEGGDVKAVFNKRDGTLSLECSVCERPVAKVAVAPFSAQA